MKTKIKITLPVSLVSTLFGASLAHATSIVVHTTTAEEFLDLSFNWLDYIKGTNLPRTENFTVLDEYIIPIVDAAIDSDQNEVIITCNCQTPDRFHVEISFAK